MSALIQVITTVEKPEDAHALARELVERRLAACAQIIGPITSIYRWHGTIEQAQEWQVWLKTRAELYADLEAAIRALHQYQVPEILALPVLSAQEGYHDWVVAETGTGMGMGD